MQKAYKGFLAIVIVIMVLLLIFSFLPTSVSAEEIVIGYTDTRSFAKSKVEIKSYISELKVAEGVSQNVEDNAGSDDINSGLWFPILKKGSDSGPSDYLTVLEEATVTGDWGEYSQSAGEVITSGLDPDRVVGSVSTHLANDIAPIGGSSPSEDIWIVAPVDGIIVTSTLATKSFDTFIEGSFGNYIVIQSGDYYTLLAHLDGREGKWLNLKEGSTVEKGQIVGNMGSTGHSTGRHLHIEVYTKVEGVKRYYNPTDLFGHKKSVSECNYWVKTNGGVVVYDSTGKRLN